MINLLNIISKYQLKDKKFLLAISGGVDSMVLLELFKNTKLNFCVANCNFNLRKDSNKEVELVNNYCNKFKIDFHTVIFDTKSFMIENSVAVQEAARELRYNYFSELKKELNYDILVTAHHLDDNIETFLINTIRGSGIKGLSSMKVYNGDLFRPLLGVEKNDIYEFSKNNNVKYIEDLSNQSNKYLRNKIRNIVLPTFQNLDRKFKNSWAKSITNIQEADDYISFQVKKIINDLSLESYLFIKKIDVSKIKNHEFFLLKHFLIDLGLNQTQLNNLLSSLNSKEEKRFLTSKSTVVINRGVLLYFTNAEKMVYNDILINEINDFIQIPFVSSIVKNEFSGFNNNFIYLNLDKFDFPLKFCKTSHGDVFNFLGTKNHQKINDFLSKKKTSIIEKENTYALKTANNNVILIFPNYISDKVKIKNENSSFLKLDLS